MNRVIFGLIGLGLIGCQSGKQAPSTPVLENKPSVMQVVPMPSPPQGTILPRTGSPRQARYWGKPGASTWEAHYHVDRTNAQVQRLLANARFAGLPLDPGDAGLKLYLDQVQAAGVKVTSDDVTQFSYDIQEGALVVTVLSDDEHTNHAPDEFLVFVDVPGG